MSAVGPTIVAEAEDAVTYYTAEGTGRWATVTERDWARETRREPSFEVERSDGVRCGGECGFYFAHRYAARWVGRGE